MLCTPTGLKPKHRMSITLRCCHRCICVYCVNQMWQQVLLGLMDMRQRRLLSYVFQLFQTHVPNLVAPVISSSTLYSCCADSQKQENGTLQYGHCYMPLCSAEAQGVAVSGWCDYFWQRVLMSLSNIAAICKDDHRPTSLNFIEPLCQTHFSFDEPW